MGDPSSFPFHSPPETPAYVWVTCGVYVAVAVGVNFPRSKDQAVLCNYCHGTKQYMQVPESYMEEEFCCSALASWKQKCFYLVCDILMWKLSVPSPFHVHSVPGLSVLERTCQSKSKLHTDNSESVWFCPSVVSSVCLFLVRVVFLQVSSWRKYGQWLRSVLV